MALHSRPWVGGFTHGTFYTVGHVREPKHLYSCGMCVYLAFYPMDETATINVVAVQFGPFNQLVKLRVTPGSVKNEREILKEQTRITFSDKIKQSDKIMFQLKDKSWNGMFFDFQGTVVPEQSVFKVLVETPEVSSSEAGPSHSGPSKVSTIENVRHPLTM